MWGQVEPVPFQIIGRPFWGADVEEGFSSYLQWNSQTELI